MINIIAFYLPQFHPIPENDMFWGKVFTEWVNVRKAKSLYGGHYQPQIPTELGYYDLRTAETMKNQALLAASYGVDAFCYYYYWFAGKRCLKHLLTEFLKVANQIFHLHFVGQTNHGQAFGMDAPIKF